MTAAKVCARCGRPIPGDAPDGACPNCLFAAAFDTGAGAGGATDAEPSPEELAPLFPGLTIESVLGRGGMGVVYKARHKALDRDVALKVLPAGRAGDAAFAERFQREARALAKLQHPNIVAVHDFGETGGLCWLVMEFVDGANIRQAMAAGTIHPKEALAIVPQICDALQYAHEHGVVHRDIKPENVLLDKSGRVKVADFGLAKLMAGDDADRTLTGAGQVMGTPHYMAPEQWERPKDVDHRADIYSLGVVFYEMLTGELPIGRFAAPSKKSHVDARIDEIVLRTLERERDLRYQQVAQVKTDMGRASEPRRSRRRGRAELPDVRVLTAAELCRQDRGREAIAGALLFASGLNSWLGHYRHPSLLFVPVTGVVLLAFAGYGSFRPTLEPDAARKAWRRFRFWSYVVLSAFVLAAAVWAGLREVPADMWERASFDLSRITAFSSTFVALLFLVGLMRRWNMVAFVLMLLLMGAGVSVLVSLSTSRDLPRMASAISLAQHPENAFRAEDGDGHSLEIPFELRARIDGLWRAVRGRTTEPTLDAVATLYTPADLARLRSMSDDERAAKAVRGALGLPLLPNQALPRPISEFELVRVRFIDPDYALATISAGTTDVEFRFETDRSDVARTWYFSADDARVK